MTKKTTKIEQLKIDMGYRKKPDSCSNCMYYVSEVVIKEFTYWDGSSAQYPEEKNLRCSVGGFAVKKSNVCNNHFFDVTKCQS